MMHMVIENDPWRSWKSHWKFLGKSVGTLLIINDELHCIQWRQYFVVNSDVIANFSFAVLIQCSFHTRCCLLCTSHFCNCWYDIPFLRTKCYMYARSWSSWFDCFVSCRLIHHLTGWFRCMKCMTSEFLCAVIVIVDAVWFSCSFSLRVIVLISILSPFTVAVLVLKK